MSYLNLMTLEGFVHYGGGGVSEQSGSQTWQPGSREKHDSQVAFSCPLCSILVHILWDGTTHVQGCLSPLI